MNASLRNWSLPGSALLAALLLAIGAWLFWPGAAGPDLLDDRSSVMKGGDLAANPDEVLDFILGDKSGVLGRSVSMATFALEKLYLDGGMASSKKVNILLHLANGALFMWLCALLFRYQEVPGYRWLAVLLGAAWLLHPLLVSSVLYVVQRMAMLAAFFMLLSAIAFVRWRLALINGRGGVPGFLPVPLLLVTGLFAKENAIVLVPILLVMEVLWFRFEGPGGRQLRWLKGLSRGLIGAGTLALAAYCLMFWESLASAFGGRQFTLEERLLTQLRILWDYTGQWFWPQVSRMGLYHDDFALSRSLAEPASTGWALLAWLLLGVACALLVRWRDGRLVVFGVAWFLLAQSVESSVLPLELYFEHRNYFPALGFMLALGGLYAMLVRRWPEPAAPLLVSLFLALVILAGLASSQVQVWSSRPLLNIYHLNGHPRSFRANTDMAAQMAELGEIEAAYRFSRAAHDGASLPAAQGERWGDYQLRNIALACIARAEVPAKQFEELGTVHPQRPFSSANTFTTLVRMIQDGGCASVDAVHFADRMAEILLVQGSWRVASPPFFSNMAVLENALQRYDKAYAYAEKLLGFYPNYPRGLLMKLHFAVALGRVDEADSVIARLVELETRGKLTANEQKSLALYRKD